MELNDSAFVAAREKKKRQKRIRNWIILGVVAVVVIVGVILLLNVLGQADASVSTLTYRATTVSTGEISTTLSGSGTLTAAESVTVTAPADARVEAVYKAPGETIAAGEAVMLLSSDTVEEELADLYDDLATAQSRLAGTTKARSSLKITASKKGVVKDIVAAPGDAAEDMRYLCRISTDGLMKLVIDAPEGLKPYATVSVTVDGLAVEGSVSEISEGKATILIEDDGYSVGTAASAADAAGTALGSGTLEVNGHVLVTADAGCIDEVLVSDNETVAKGATLFLLAEGAPSATYQTRKASEASLLKQIEELEDSLEIKAEWDGILASLAVKAGDEVTSGTTLCELSGTDAFELSLSIDELDLSSVAIGQTATVTLDAVEGEYTGTVTNLSYSGSGSYVTTYTAIITTEPIAGAYPGMSASAEIITDTSGSSLIVPVNAVQYDGEEAFVYLAPEDAEAGASVDAAALDLDSLTRVSVTTGMSNGSYIAVTAEGLAAGDLIYMPDLATSAVYTEDEDASVQMGTFSFDGSQMGGGQMPGGQMPSGQMPGGNMGGMGSGQRSGQRTGG